MTDDQRSAEQGPMERELRSMLHRAVAEVQPDPTALPRLRRAIPRRRVRRRNAWMGVAASVLLVAAAVPTIRGVQQLDLSDGPVAGHAIADQTAGETAGPNRHGPTASPHGSRSPGQVSVPETTATGTVVATASGTLSTGATAPPVGAVPVPECARADLGQGGSHLSAADSSGKVYGWFMVRNTSGRSCGLTGAGTVAVSAATGTDPAKVRVVDHTAGDPAAALPDPGAGTRALVLAPLEGYQVQFGWVPDAPCQAGAPGAHTEGPGTAPPGVPSSDNSPTATATASPTGPGPTSSITLAHTPQAGVPVAATAVVNGACAGTVYRAAPQQVPAASSSPTTG